MRNVLLILPRKSKQLIMMLADTVFMPLTLWAATALRFGEWWPKTDDLYLLLLLTPFAIVPVFIKAGLYRAVVRYMTDQMVFTVIKAVSLSVLLLVTISALFHLAAVPRSSFVIYWGAALLYVMGSRFAARSYLLHAESGFHRVRSGKQVLIYGVGETGAKLAAALQAGCQFDVVGFLDDKVLLRGGEIAGLRVYSVDQLSDVLEAEQWELDAVLLAVPLASHKRRQEILRQLEPFHIPIKTIPSAADLATGVAQVSEIKLVEIEDLLGRDSVLPVTHLLEQCIRGKSVMVTGAGGSIGSELCRQILRQSPTILVLFERSEFSLYQIHQELEQVNATLGNVVKIIPVLGSVVHQLRVERVMLRFAVQTVYHAAAYKHVPLVENNMIEGMLNNVFGTWRTAEAARKAKVETFVLISTDKAVRPTNVMGASKRFAELVLQAYAREDSSTRFCMVRFGNVLGSSGSVVPLFKKQIASGGPVTVTHPEITRYFMTIPEAAELVLQAGAMGQGGDVFVLDMGTPVKILDFARKIIYLSGFTIRDEANPSGDIEIQFSGLRAGEKLYEELLIGGNVTGTDHPLIMRAEEVELPLATVEKYLNQLDEAFHKFDCETVRGVLLDVVDGYQPAGGICDYVWKQSEVQTSLHV